MKSALASPRMRFRLVLTAVAMLATGCVGGNVVFGSIPPSTFQFTTVIEHRDNEPGGWQVAQIIVLLGRISNMFPRAATCDIEVGTPLVNTRQGYISEETAQAASALAADRPRTNSSGNAENPLPRCAPCFESGWDTISRIRG